MKRRFATLRTAPQGDARENHASMHPECAASFGDANVTHIFFDVGVGAALEQEARHLHSLETAPLPPYGTVQRRRAMLRASRVRASA